jgi:hypothetical protein
MHGVDVLLQPFPDGQAFGGAAQQAGVAVRVDQTRHQQTIRQALDRYAGVSCQQGRCIAYCLDAPVRADQYGAIGEHIVIGIHREQDVGLKDERVHG